MKKMKRLLALVLAMAMALSIAVTTSFAADETTLTIPEAIALGNEIGSGKTTEEKYSVTGTVAGFNNYTYGNMYIVDEEGNSLYIYGTYDADGKRYDVMETKPVTGDTVTLVGVINNYKGTVQMKNATVVGLVAGGVENTDPATDSILTIAEANALGESKFKDTYTEGKYYVTGTITEIASTRYGNMYIADEDGNTLYVYGAYSASGDTNFSGLTPQPVAGDTITLYGVIGNYNGAQMKNAWIRNEEYVINYDVTLVVGENDVSPDKFAEYTIYGFTPDATGEYTITVSDDASVAVWGGSLASGYVYALEGNTFLCTEADTQTALVAVSGTDNCTVTITKTGEYTPIVWTAYKNTHTPDVANTLCYTLDGTTVAADGLVKGDDGFYYTADGAPVFVNFNYEPMSLNAMLSYGNVRVVKGEEYIDYTAALTAYQFGCGFYPLTDDLKQILSDVAENNNWASFGVVWSDLCTTATQEHTFVDDVCSVCEAFNWGSAAYPVDLTADLLYENDFSATVTVGAGETVYYCAYRVGGMIMTINGGEGVACTTDGMWTPYTWTITNEGASAAEYVIVVAHPVGSWSNPAELNTTDWNGNTATVSGTEYYFSWVAEGTGTLTITPAYSNANGWYVAVNNNTTYAQDTLTSPDEYLVVNVNAGDEIVVIVNTYDENDPYNAPAGTVVFDATYTAKRGSAENPYFINDQNDETSSVEYAATAAPGETTYFAGYGLAGTTLSITPVEGTTVYVNDVEVTGDYVIPAGASNWAPTSITIVSTNAEESVVDMVFTYPIGSWENPDTLTVGTSVVELAAGNNGYLYNYTATCPGTLTVKISGSNWQYQANYYGDPDSWADDVYGDMLTYADETVVDTVSFNVIPGAEMQLTLNTYNPEDPWGMNGALAGTITVEVTFEHADYDGCECANCGDTKHDWVFHAAVEPTCETDGNIAYHQCSVCGAAKTEDGIPLGRYGWILGVKHDGLTFVEAVANGCHNNGNIAHWYCADCNGHWTDEALTQVTNVYNVILPATGAENVTHVEAVEAGCHNMGNIEHWVCGGCNGLFTDEACTQETFEYEVILPATGAENVTYVEAVANGCHNMGNIEHWVCDDCGGLFTDEACTQETFEYEVILPATGAENVTHVEAVEAGCHNMGNIEHWVCDDCGGCFAEAECIHELFFFEVILPATGATSATKVEAVAPTCTENGNIEYWVCADCGGYFAEAECIHELFFFEVVDPAPGHNYEDGVCTVCGEADPDYEASPKTGDTAPVVAVIALGLAAAAAFVVLTKKRRA